MCLNNLKFVTAVEKSVFVGIQGNTVFMLWLHLTSSCLCQLCNQYPMQPL